MKINSNVIFCLLFVISWVSSAQIDSINTNQGRSQHISKPKEKHKSAWIVKWAPSSLLTPETPTLQFGLEFLPKENGRFGFEFSYGLKCIIGKNEFDNRFDRQYNKYHLEARYYFRSPLDRKKLNFFLALEVFHVDYSYSKNNGSYIANDKINYVYDFARVNKIIDGYSLKAGYVFKLDPSISLECFVGFGARAITANYFDLVNRKEAPVLPGVTFLDFKVNNEGYSARLHVALGVKVLYRF